MSQVASDGADRPPRETAGTAAPGGRRRLGRILGALIIAAALVVAAVFARTSGIPDDQIVGRAADLHSLPQTLPATAGPPPAVAGLRFPSLAAAGWTPVGGRRDALAGRTATTLFYVGGGGRRLAVTVLSGQALPPPPGSRVTRRDGVAVARSTSGDRTVVSWRRAGRTTIMSAVTTDPDELVRLARSSTPRPRGRG